MTGLPDSIVLLDNKALHRRRMGPCPHSIACDHVAAIHASCCTHEAVHASPVHHGWLVRRFHSAPLGLYLRGGRHGPLLTMHDGGELCLAALNLRLVVFRMSGAATCASCSWVPCPCSASCCMTVL